MERSRAGNKGTLYITTANEVPAVGKSLGVAQADVEGAIQAGPAGVIEGHRKHWHDFYPRSFLSIPDPRLESFYWIQIYKIASASRPDAPPLDNSGPWFRVNQWPGLWWNLNVQITYWPVYTANRLELSQNLIDELDTNFDGLLSTFKRPNLGDFAWVLHNYYLQYRFEADWAGLASRFLPKAREVTKAYDKYINRDADGKLSLLPMESPEWEGFRTYPNSTYNLALLRWLLTAMIEIERKVPGSVSPDELKGYQTTLDNLVPFPTDEFGLRISADQSVSFSHRHYSHLLGLYPLFVLNPDSLADRELVIKSVQHWHHIENGKGLAGYSYTGGAALYAALGMGDEAHGMLTHFLTRLKGMSRLFDNTMYVEVGKNPVLETPHSAASGASELLLQSWGDKVRVFPAVPTAWKAASFDNLRAQGAFLVSANRAEGVTQWVVVKSLKGEPCTLKVPDWQGPLNTPRAIPLPTPGEYQLTLAAGEELLLHPQGTNINALVAPVPMAPADRNLFGLKKGRELKTKQEWPDVPLSVAPTSPASATL